MRQKRLSAREKAIMNWISEPDKSEQQTLYEWIKQYETPESRAHKMPEWEGLKRQAWESYERYRGTTGEL